MSLSKAAEELLARIREGDVVSPERKDSDVFWHTTRNHYLMRENAPGQAIVTSQAKELLDAGLVQIEEWPKGRVHLRATAKAERQAAREARIRDEAGAMYAVIRRLLSCGGFSINSPEAGEVLDEMVRIRERIEGQ